VRTVGPSDVHAKSWPAASCSGTDLRWMWKHPGPSVLGPTTCFRLVPPPAITCCRQPDGGSRPGAGDGPPVLRISHIGVRPNHHPNNQSRIQPKTRCFRSLIRVAEEGLVGEWAILFELLIEIGCGSSKTGVLIITSACRAPPGRRASRQLVGANGRGGPGFTPVQSPALAGDSLEKSSSFRPRHLHAKGQLVRMDARTAISRSPVFFGRGTFPAHGFGRKTLIFLPRSDHLSGKC